MNAARQSTPLLDRARRIVAATIFPPGLPSADPIELPTWEQLKLRLEKLAAGRPIVFRPGKAAYPDFDPFWAITVSTAAGDYLCTIADRWHDEVDMTRALAELRRRG